MKKISKETNHTPSISWRGINLGTKPVIGYYSLTVIQLIVMYFTEHHFWIFIAINWGYIIVAYFVLNYLDKKRKAVGTAVKFIAGKCVVEEGSKVDIFLRQYPLTTEDMYDGKNPNCPILDEVNMWVDTKASDLFKEFENKREAGLGEHYKRKGLFEIFKTDTDEKKD